MKTLAFIPLRGGSKSIPGKNLKPLAGKSLFQWTAEAALKCPEIDAVVIATDDQGIKSAAMALQHPKLSVYDRKPENATDTASTESVMLEYAEAHEFDTMVLIQATSPLLTHEDLSNGLNKLRETDADCVLSVVEQKRFLWALDENGYGQATNYTPAKRPRRQDFQGHLVENGAFYICSRQGLLETACRLHGRIALQHMREETYVELDEPHDWAFLESLLLSTSTVNVRPPPSTFDVQRSTFNVPHPSSTFNVPPPPSTFDVPPPPCPLPPPHLSPLTSIIRLFLTDVDGVLTDAGMYYSENGDELKKFNTRDAVGLRLLQDAGIKVGIFTSENTQIVARRAKKIGVDILRQGCKNKAADLDALLGELNLTPSQVAFIGDDINDLGILKKVGFAITPADGRPENKNLAHYICHAKGGEGAVREVAEVILSGIKEKDQTER